MLQSSTLAITPIPIIFDETHVGTNALFSLLTEFNVMWFSLFWKTRFEDMEDIERNITASYHIISLTPKIWICSSRYISDLPSNPDPAHSNFIEETANEPRLMHNKCKKYLAPSPFPKWSASDADQFNPAKQVMLGDAAPWDQVFKGLL